MRKLAGLALMALLAGAGLAAPPLVTIQDVLYKADGTRFNGVLFIQWKSFQTSDNSNIPTQNVTVPVVDGVLSVKLAPTSDASTGAYYEVRYNSDGRILTVETWTVPPSTATLKLKDVRSGTAGSVVTPPASTAVQISDVVGLTDALANRPVKDPGYANSRTLVSTATGTVGTAVGSATDCMHVDGSSGPCNVGTLFVDGEVPAGLVNGVNAAFTLTYVPNPTSSLAVFRNGLMQKQNVDYTLSSQTVTFIAGVPQTGDIIQANYRTSTSGAAPTQGDLAPVAAAMDIAAPVAAVAAAASTSGQPQIICNKSGVNTSSASMVRLGTCTLTPAQMQTGDRIEIRYDFLKAGSVAGTSVLLKLGNSPVMARSAGAGEGMLSGRTEFTIVQGNQSWTTLSWGSITPVVATGGMAMEDRSSNVVINVLGQLGRTAADVLTLANLTVVRYPAQ